MRYSSSTIDYDNFEMEMAMKDCILLLKNVALYIKEGFSTKRKICSTIQHESSIIQNTNLC